MSMQSLVRDASVIAAIVGAVVSGTLIIMWEISKRNGEKRHRTKALCAMFTESIGHDLEFLERLCENHFTLHDIERGFDQPKTQLDDQAWRRFSDEMFALDQRRARALADYYRHLGDFRRSVGGSLSSGERVSLGEPLTDTARRVLALLGEK
jgi:hypothetical protein